MTIKFIKLLTLSIIIFIIGVFFISLNKSSFYDTKGLEGQIISGVKLEQLSKNRLILDDDLKKNDFTLINFWASWCGPCRRENPAVVQLYEQYKDQGFTVISVSLDKDKAKWLAAIEKDNLSWPNHVSDLGSWNSKVARQYGVSSIPFTVLLDAEGKVIKTKLRSHDLAVELAKLFDK